MLKEKALAGVSQGTLQEEDEREENSVRILSVCVFMLFGLLLPQARIYGMMSPFGISLTAATDGVGAVLVYVSSLIGYLLAGDMELPLRYMAAVAIAGSVRWVFSVVPSVAQSKAFPPLLSFGATLVSGILMGAATDVFSVMLVVAESMIAGGFAYFFGEVHGYLHRKSSRTALTMTEQVGVVLMGATLLMAVTPLEFSGIAPGRILAGVLVMLMARSGREQSGAVAGVVLGTAMALCDPERPYVALALCFGGLLAGLFSQHGRFAIAGVYLIAGLVLCLSTTADLRVAAFAYETAASCVVFTVLPRNTDKWLRKYLVFGQHLPAVEGMRRAMTLRLDVAANAMGEVAETVERVSKKLSKFGAPDLGSMYRSVGDTVCTDCNLRMYCWEANFSSVMDAFNQLTPILRENGEVNKEDIGGFLARTCRRTGAVAQQVDMGYRQYLQRENAWQRLSEIRTVIADQFAGMGDILSELGAKITADRRVDTGAAGRVVSLCEDFGMPVEEAICFCDHRDHMTVELLAEDVGVCLDGGRWFREMERCCGREFDKPALLQMQGMVKVTLTERPRFRVDMGCAQTTCVGEKLSGDVCEQYVDGGRLAFILSDGMGSGGRAAVDGAMAAGITARLLRVGLQPHTVLKMVNTALLAKSGDESLTTLDVLEIDLFTGSMQTHKAGAATTLLKSGGRLSRIEGASLPVGILRDTGFVTHRDALKDGDVLLMMSDGMLFDGVGWIEEYLEQHDGDAKALANGILELACEKQRDTDHTDDMTVAVFCMQKR